MANLGGQKSKILAEYRILLLKSDEAHPINAMQMARLLAEEGISAERKAIYKDMEILQDAGIDLIKGDGGYYIGSRTFELSELKLLVDAVGASKFISEAKSRELIKKISSLASENEARQLARQVVVPDRDTGENNRIFYAIDVIYQCIDEDRQMSFSYEEWNIKKEKVLRHGGERYLVSPAFLLRNNENYYLVAYDEKAEDIRHYRVDKIVQARTEEEVRGGAEKRKALNPSEYAASHVSMFAGKEKIVTISCKSYLVGALLDKFGEEISIRPDPDKAECIRARIPIAVSPQLYGWLTGIQAVIVAPADEKVKFREYLREMLQE